MVVTPPARRALAEKLPEGVATAAIHVMTTALIENPRDSYRPL
jgi:hypothetical protein